MFLLYFGVLMSPNYVLAVLKRFDTRPAWYFSLDNIVLKFLLRNFITARIYKKLCYVDTGFNINRLLVCALFGRPYVAKICFCDLSWFSWGSPDALQTPRCCSDGNISYDISFWQLLWRCKAIKAMLCWDRVIYVYLVSFCLVLASIGREIMYELLSWLKPTKWQHWRPRFMSSATIT